MVHYPPETKNEMIEICKNLEIFKKEKIILNYGFSNIDYNLFNYAYRRFKISALENSLNLLNFNQQIKSFQNVNKNVIKIAHSTLAQGMLTAKYSLNSKFSTSDRRHRMELFSKKNLIKNFKKVSELKKIANKYNTSTTVLSLSYLLNSKHVDSIILGVKNFKQFQNNISCLNFKFNSSLEKKINSIFK